MVERKVGRYEILREIGRGGMATVYLARQIDLDRRVALKELGALRAEDPSFVKRFLREAQLAGSLSHPNVVTVHDYFEHERRALHRDGVRRPRIGAALGRAACPRRRSAASCGTCSPASARRRSTTSCTAT